MGREVDISCEDALIAVREMRMMDDAFMQLCFADAPQVVELVLRIVLNMSDLCVETVKTQEKVVGIGKRSVCFDVLAHDTGGVWYNIEIQKDARRAGVFCRCNVCCGEWRSATSSSLIHWRGMMSALT